MIETCVNGTICADLVKGIPAAFVALVIGAIAARIAYNQYLVAKAKLNLDLLDKRLVIYLIVYEELSNVANTGRVVSPSLHGVETPFDRAIPQARFLFGKDVEEYINLCTSKWIDMHNLEMKNYSKATEAAEMQERYRALTKWFYQEVNVGIKERFAKFLNFEHWK